MEAVQLAKRLWALDLCGPCWAMLLEAIRLELAGAGPGGHLDHGQADDELLGEVGDWPTRSPPLGEVHPTD